MNLKLEIMFNHQNNQYVNLYIPIDDYELSRVCIVENKIKYKLSTARIIPKIL